MTTLERAARALQDEIERQVAEPGYLGWGVGQEGHRPPLAKTYVDGDLDVSALARAVLMAVREIDPVIHDQVTIGGWLDDEMKFSEAWQGGIDAILGVNPPNES